MRRFSTISLSIVSQAQTISKKKVFWNNSNSSYSKTHSKISNMSSFMLGKPHSSRPSALRQRWCSSNVTMRLAIWTLIWKIMSGCRHRRRNPDRSLTARPPHNATNTTVRTLHREHREGLLSSSSVCSLRPFQEALGSSSNQTRTHKWHNLTP